ncbi:twin transmembrane helix small protein [Arsenicitalea aurantiaca]|uniref:Twin transmembrane helix small protein n=1 Tax=Arsenicitalea aurantiaca TaxID=1783274 RepID=A0A433X5S7_9HYPH|nr:twin transmembrane helix small protein [Arsenicitalea aurantiaca]RUT29404.1 twin transmembrane helix small protein [Arsenicitalea aurantiaca]
MQDLLNFAIVIAVVIVGIILLMGLWNMLKGGDGNRSQQLMRLRVIAQAVAVILMMGALFFFGRG